MPNEIKIPFERNYSLQMYMIRTIELKNIKPNPFNARLDYAEEPIEALAEEIKEAGFWAGALRGRMKDGKVELCFGHRRWMALKKLGHKEAQVDIVSLSDEEMAWQSLAENLQRQGLNDMEKAEGIKKLFDQTLILNGGKRMKAYELVARRLGYPQNSIEELVSFAELPQAIQKLIRKKAISGKAAKTAYNLGGKQMVETAIEKKLTFYPLTQLSKAINNIPDKKIRERVKAKVITGEITSADEVKKKAEPMVRAKKEKEEPPDMMVIIAMWSDDIEAWIERLNEMLPYRSHMNRAPAIANKFRKTARQFIVKLEKLIEEDERMERTVN